MIKNNIIISMLLYISSFGISIEQAYLQLAQAFHAQNDITHAITNYKNALEYNNKNSYCLSELAKLVGINDKQQALHYLDELLLCEPTNNWAAQKAAEISYNLEKYEQALKYSEVVLKIAPTAHAQYLYGNILYKLGNIQESIAAFKQAIHNKSDFFDAYYQLAHALRKEYDFAQALAVYETMLNLQPHSIAIQFEKANTLVLLGDYEKALSIYTQLIETFPNNSTLLLNKALTLRKQGILQDAIKELTRLISLEPSNEMFHTSMAHTLIMANNYEDGFKELFLSNKLTYKSSRLLQTLEETHNKTIFIPADWCLDDIIQFLRYLPLLKKQHSKIVIQSMPTLISVLQRCPYIDMVISVTEQIPAFDYIAPITSLPALCKTISEKNVPLDFPYIFSDQTLAVFWKSNLGLENIKKIGIYWNIIENPHNAKEDRNIPSNLLHLFDKFQNYRFYCLHSTKENPQNVKPTMLLTHLGSGFADINEHTISDLMAIIHNLDLLITRDCLLAHLAGAMGKKVFLGLPYTADWRWGQKSGPSPWYPSMTIFKQSIPGNWSEILKSMISCL